MENIVLEVILPTQAEKVYNAWLSSEEHTAMTGGEAECSAEEGAFFSAWDGYITGMNKVLTPYREIVQSWRTSEFLDQDPDSLLHIKLSEHPEGCLLQLMHSEIPESQTSDYTNGWIEHYFTPMKAYFANL